ncbi:MAG TPA: response regulator [Bacteroidetes bacterium]|nr:response regulator [Bacteroidota bacterium]
MLSTESSLKAVIIDDQEDIRSINRSLLSQNFPDIEVVGEANGVETGIDLIQKTNPDLVLLDIEIKGGTGFNILQKIRPYNFMVIFITAFDEFAIKAIKFSAIDYILKPINETEFCAAIERVPLVPTSVIRLPCRFKTYSTMLRIRAKIVRLFFEQWNQFFWSIYKIFSTAKAIIATPPFTLPMVKKYSFHEALKSMSKCFRPTGFSDRTNVTW